MTSTFEKFIALGENYLYITRTSSIGGTTVNSAGRWDGSAGGMEMVDNGANSFGLAVITGGVTNDFYLCGTFTQVGGDTTVNKVAYFNGTDWEDLNGASIFNGHVTCLAYDSVNEILYAASHQSTNTANRIGMYSGGVWTGIAEPTVSTYVKMALDSDGNLYIGYGHTFKRRIHSSGLWESISTSIGGTVTDVKYDSVNDRIYLVLYTSSNNIKYYNVSDGQITTLETVTSYPRAITFDSSQTPIVAVQSPSTYQGSVQKYNGSGWDNLFNYQNVSGVLDVEIDSNDNIYCFANAGSLTVGKSPYTSGNWEPFSATTSVNYGGPVGGGSQQEEEQQGMNFQVGDLVCLKAYPAQQGTVVRLNPLGASNALVIRWDTNGHMYNINKRNGFFEDDVGLLEHM